MKLIIIVFGGLIMLAGVFMLIRREKFLQWMLSVSDSRLLHALAAAVRVALGLVLLLYATRSRYPMVFEILGWISIIAGVILAFLPQVYFQALMKWATTRFKPWIALGAPLAIAFGAFLIYAVV